MKLPTDRDRSEDERAAWLERWAPACPLGYHRRLCRLLGHREREPGRLQLRVVLGLHEGVCAAIAEEIEETVYVRVLACMPDDEDEPAERDYMDCPVHVYLEQPLEDRSVVDVDTGEPLALHVPSW